MDNFPVDYQPVRYPFFGVRSTVSGVGTNITRALSTLGDDVTLLSIIGQDFASDLVRKEFQSFGLGDEFILSSIQQTAQSVILYDGGGRRLINTDLKDIQQQSYPIELFQMAADRSKIVVLCNINFSRPLLEIARQAGKIIATDVHAISSLEDTYNRDFMAAADILLMSDELLPEPPADFALKVADEFGTSILVIGMGSNGALLYQSATGRFEHIPAVNPRPIVSTIGAGDALFACFLHYIARGFAPPEALGRAVVFAGYKIGVSGAAEGFLEESGLEELYLTYQKVNR